MRKKNNKKKKKSGSSIIWVFIILVAIIGVVIFASSGGSLAGDVFSKSKRSTKEKGSVPQQLRWEKAFRFGNSKDDKPKGNFLQHQTEMNKKKKEK